MYMERQGPATPRAHHADCGVGAIIDQEYGHETVTDALELLANMDHRGATGVDPDTGDGAGIVLEQPEEFFSAELDVPPPDLSAVGSLFLPQDRSNRSRLMGLIERQLEAQDLTVHTWRSVPTNSDVLGAGSAASEPATYQIVVGPGDALTEEADITDAFDIALYRGRRAIETALKDSEYPGADRTYVCSLDRQTIIYKGLLTGSQLRDYYPDLTDDRITSRFAIVHARFSTNTLGAWHLAHPFRTLVHNGEFNTIQGNENWMRARENEFACDRLPDETLETIKPVISDTDQSDSASLDNVLELLLASGYSLPRALRMIIPEAWRGATELSTDRQAFYDFHASLVEPWDGPALVCATDGEQIAAILDRNGLRPCRYVRTTDDRIVLASEEGALDIPPANIDERGRLGPGEMILIDPETGQIADDAAIFEDMTDPKYGEWVTDGQVRLSACVPSGGTAPDEIGGDDAGPLEQRQVAFGYTTEEIEDLLVPMATAGNDPVGSMGDDTPLSVLADYDRPLFSYFKQQFAQVTNPPIDYIREEIVTSLETRLGPQRNLLDPGPDHARQLVADSPVLTDERFQAIESLSANGLSSYTIDCTTHAGQDMADAIERIRREAIAAIESGNDVLILSDRGHDTDRLPLPSLLVTSAVHQHLVARNQRDQVGLVVDAGDARTVHQFVALIGYGAGAVHPRLAMETVRERSEGTVETYIGALEAGLRKTMARMGIATVESYQGAQLFEAVGLDDAFVEEYFTGTASRTSGVGLPEIAGTVRDRHERAHDAGSVERSGEFEYRTGGITHLWRPDTVSALQEAVRNDDRDKYGEFSAAIEADTGGARTLRGLLTFDSNRDPIPIEEVEPVDDIVTRFSTAPMSLGSISPEAHETNAIAMNRIGGRANCGEGGEPAERFGTDKESVAKQVASGRFGVTARYLAAAEELQIKMAQGSKPGEGGHLPGEKVTPLIASVRCATEGVDLISPPPQHDIYSIEDLKQLIFDLRAINPEVDINVKLVAQEGIGTVAAGVAKAGADIVHVSGHAGGTGASPMSSIKHAGVPWELGVAEANQLLTETGLRDQVRIAVDGGLRTGRDVAVGAALGADEFVFGTAPLVTAGCVMSRICHTNRCPVGVATQKEALRNRFPGEPEHVIRYMQFVAGELREIMADLGYRTVDELVGSTSVLDQQTDIAPASASQVDLADLLASPSEPSVEPQSGATQDRAVVDDGWLATHGDAIAAGDPVAIDCTLTNRDRTVGARLSRAVVTNHGESGLPEGTIDITATGVAGQSFGAFLAPGIECTLEGVANDHVGKGLAGGRIEIAPSETVEYSATDSIAIGNVALYGATDGELYVNGRAGERFAVRNSGALAVCEGAGDHACEYMTGGIVAILGEAGSNVAAGMSGGIAYLYDPDGTARQRINTDTVTVSNELTAMDERALGWLLDRHHRLTGSDRAGSLREEWNGAVEDFVVVEPDAYMRVLDDRSVTDVRETIPDQSPARHSGDVTGD